MLSSMKAWMLKHDALMLICIAATFAIITTIIVLFLIYKVLCKNPVFDIHSINNTPVLTIFGMSRGLIEFWLEELKQATNNFGESNLIGPGSYGPVYNGLLRGTTSAIKRLSGPLHPRFLAEVAYLSKIRHCNVVNLLGYCCENDEQILVYEYLGNGNVRDHLRGTGSVMNFKKRISIALGAAKGLQYLHKLTPPLIHNRFKTAKVLLDADLNAKVSGAGLSRMLETRNQEANNDDDDDLEVGFDDQEETLGEATDVFRFGLFLLELITGEEETEALTTDDDLLQWLGPRIGSDTFADQMMDEPYESKAVESAVMITLKCLAFPATNRAKMEEIVADLEKIHQEDSTSDDGGSTRITLGSELFAVN